MNVFVAVIHDTFECHGPVHVIGVAASQSKARDIIREANAAVSYPVPGDAAKYKCDRWRPTVVPRAAQTIGGVMNDIHDIIARTERSPGNAVSIDPPDGGPECPNCDGQLEVVQDRYTFEATCIASRPCDACVFGSGSTGTRPAVLGVEGVGYDDHVLAFLFACGECDGTGKRSGCGYTYYTQDPRL